MEEGTLIHRQQSMFSWEVGTTLPQPHQEEQYEVDLLPQLEDCNQPQSPHSLQELAMKYKPTKFVGYAHTNYDQIYPQYLERYRYKKFKFLEIGMDTGNGTLLWREYFPCATLVGLEYSTANLQTRGAEVIQTVQGDQGNETFLETDFLEQTDGGNFDVIVDDGGHHYEQQIASYRVLFDKALNPGGIYLLEDIETSYWRKGTSLYHKEISRGGCYGEQDTVINKFKLVIDVGTCVIASLCVIALIPMRVLQHLTL
jgi:hypothetical protein